MVARVVSRHVTLGRTPRKKRGNRSRSLDSGVSGGGFLVSRLARLQYEIRYDAVVVGRIGFAHLEPNETELIVA